MTSKTVTKNQSPLVPANDQEHVRQGKLQALKQMGRDPFRIDRFGVSSSIAGFISRHHALKQQQSGANLDLKVVRLAGRVLNVRAFGGVVFLIIADCTAKLQLFCPKNQLSTAVFNTILALDRGDIIGCRGTAMMTKTQQLSLQVRDVKLLAKSVKVWPNKFQGLVDTETKYRQRYLDLVLSARSRAVFMYRAQIITALRAFLNRHRYIEVETPVLEANFGGASARPFTTTHHAYNTNFYLRIAPELALKRLIVGGLERVYELGKVFRNEGIDADHSPEFTSLEVYTAYHNVTDTMRLCERLVRFCCQRVFKTWEFKFKTHLINFQPPFQRHHILDLLGQKLNHDFWQEHDLQRVRQIAVRAGVPVDNTITTADEGIMLLFEKLIEPDLIQPTFVVGHPASLTPLAKTNRQFPHQVDRFELYVAGMELANAYSELNDPFAQFTTFQQQVKQAATIARTVDHDYVRALAYGMPPCGGLGIGIDRLVMVLTGASNIRDVILFPTLKPVARR